jgi:hypothetical protein
LEIGLKRVEKQPYCAGERSPTPCERAPGERAPTPCERAPGERAPRPCEHALSERSPIPANVRTRASLNPTGALDNLIATPSLLVEVGN